MNIAKALSLYSFLSSLPPPNTPLRAIIWELRSCFWLLINSKRQPKKKNAGRNVNYYNCFRNLSEYLLKSNICNSMTQQFHSWYTKERNAYMCLLEDICKHIIMLSVICPKNKLPKYPSTVKWKTQLRYVPMIELYVAMWGNHLQLHTKIWMILTKCSEAARHKKST